MGLFSAKLLVNGTQLCVLGEGGQAGTWPQPEDWSLLACLGMLPPRTPFLPACTQARCRSSLDVDQRKSVPCLPSWAVSASRVTCSFVYLVPNAQHGDFHSVGVRLVCADGHFPWVTVCAGPSSPCRSYGFWWCDFYKMTKGSCRALSSLLIISTLSNDHWRLGLLRPPGGSWRGPIRVPGILAQLMPFLLRVTYCFYFFPKTLNMNQIAYEMIHWKFSSKCKKAKKKKLFGFVCRAVSDARQASGTSASPRSSAVGSPARSGPCPADGADRQRTRNPGGQACLKSPLKSDIHKAVSYRRFRSKRSQNTAQPRSVGAHEFAIWKWFIWGPRIEHLLITQAGTWQEFRFLTIYWEKS